MNLDEAVRELKKRFDMGQNEEVEEAGRTVARLQD